MGSNKKVGQLQKATGNDMFLESASSIFKWLPLFKAIDNFFI